MSIISSYVIYIWYDIWYILLVSSDRSISHPTTKDSKGPLHHPGLFPPPSVSARCCQMTWRRLGLLTRWLPGNQKIRVEVLGSYHCFKRFRMLAHGFIVWFQYCFRSAADENETLARSQPCVAISRTHAFGRGAVMDGVSAAIKSQQWRIDGFLQNTQPLALHFLDKLPETKS